MSARPGVRVDLIAKKCHLDFAERNCQRGRATAVNHPPSCCPVEPASPARRPLAPAGRGRCAQAQPQRCSPCTRVSSLCGVHGAVCMCLLSRDGPLLASGLQSHGGPSFRSRQGTGVWGAVDELLGVIMLLLKPVSPGERAEVCLRVQEPWRPPLSSPRSPRHVGVSVRTCSERGSPPTVLGAGQPRRPPAREHTSPQRPAEPPATGRGAV